MNKSLSAHNHQFCNGLLAFLPVIAYGIFPDITASQMRVPVSYFSACPQCPGQPVATERPWWMCLPCCREAWGRRTQWALISPYFSVLLHDSVVISKGQCLKQTHKNVYVPINDTHNGEGTCIVVFLRNYYIRFWLCGIIFQNNLLFIYCFEIHAIINSYYVFLHLRRA